MEMCILCHEAQEILPDGAVMVLAAFVQRSTVMSENHKRPPHNPESYDPLFMHPDLSFGTHTGSCGHIMHSHCWHRHVLSHGLWITGPARCMCDILKSLRVEH
ncbi:E3 ubiquitin-protein ligase UBR2-like isoform X2 [Ictalurus punctatus]|uniref:E3 ubiquitin-protein ligase n=1 Tax=Ictalurus punctatus TaxID=7998 RepID=A0A9F7R3C5_ICTPU|nr:E3 ubiquitin-protein ligase UBR2-like isoform X2 [Ictalurus punctatus]XP_053534486.1 E3 ubiquitin-protein ligase UBR2-like isoform X2 [Ictalurus punctatus]XP_053540424.1 E3 ubiquitin-protein ligase UBR2-like isoform X2 [Ictalurus punctatus]